MLLMPWKRFNLCKKNVLPVEYVQTLKPGDTLCDNRIYPLIWR
jgi:hypothetical protein